MALSRKAKLGIPGVASILGASMLAGYLAKKDRRKKRRRQERRYFQDAARAITFGAGVLPRSPTNTPQTFPAGYMQGNGVFKVNPPGWNDPNQKPGWAGPPPGSINIPATTDPKKRQGDIANARKTQYRRQQGEKEKEKEDYDEKIYYNGELLIYADERNSWRLLQRARRSLQANASADVQYYRARLARQFAANRKETAEYWPGGTQGGACPYTRINTITPCPDYSPSMNA